MISGSLEEKLLKILKGDYFNSDYCPEFFNNTNNTNNNGLYLDLDSSQENQSREIFLEEIFGEHSEDVINYLLRGELKINEITSIKNRGEEGKLLILIFRLWKKDIKLLDDRIEFHELENIYEGLNEIKSDLLNFSSCSSLVEKLKKYISFLSNKIENKIQYKKSSNCNQLIASFEEKLEDSQEKLEKLYYINAVFDILAEDNINVINTNQIKRNIVKGFRECFLNESLEDISKSLYDKEFSSVLHINDKYIFSKLYFGIRFYKQFVFDKIDIKKTLVQLENIINILSSLLLESDDNNFTPLKKESKNKNIIFFFNNIISVLSKISIINESNIKNIEKLLEKIKVKINQNGIKESYFTNYKLSEVYYNFSKIFKDEKEKLKTYLEKSKEECKKSIELFDDFEHTFSPFVSDFDIMKFNDGYISFSSFLPPHRSGTYSKLKKLELNIEEEILKNVLRTEINVEDIENKLKNAKKEIAKSKIKIIEVLGIFSAIILFVSSNIQVYQYVSSFSMAILFMLSFGLVLILFIFSLNLLIYERYKTFIVILVSYIALSYGLYYLGNNIPNNVFVNDSYIEEKFKEIMKEKNDLIKIPLKSNFINKHR